MDDGGVQATHQLPRTVGCSSGPEIVCQEPGGNLDPPPAGQCHSNCLHQQDGGGTHSVHLSGLAVEIWNWCICRNITVHVEHLPGLENVRADWESHHLTDTRCFIEMFSDSWSPRRDLSPSTCLRQEPTLNFLSTAAGDQIQMRQQWMPSQSHGGARRHICSLLS